MFNGIIFHQGLVNKVIKSKNGINIFLTSNISLTKKDLGISISCDGICLTLIKVKKNKLEFYLSKETLNKSKFKNIKINDQINLELPLKFGKKISGHICQGHVDCTSTVNYIKKVGKSYLFDFLLNPKIKKQIVEKASILINGISLTISKITAKGFQTWIISHTFRLTNLSKLKKNDLVNIEIDILSKYVKNYLNEK